MTTDIFGIRHHGPGSARSLLIALETLKPDAILVEGPPEADQILPLAVAPDMQPPVAVMVYIPNQPQSAVYYPFAVFSPEWQAINYGLTHRAVVRFMDLPHISLSVNNFQPEELLNIHPQNPDEQISIDPLTWLAQAAGDSDGELWWEHLVEQRQDSQDLFAAILTAITVLRQEIPSLAATDRQREAYMRQMIRTTQQAGFERIAVVCGAWHAPALAEMEEETGAEEINFVQANQEQLEATWVPWTYGRLCAKSGYGAGIGSPGWYDYLWHQSQLEQKSLLATRWLTRVAQLLRTQDLQVSTADIIAGVRLAESLAALRDRSVPGLAELNQATETVLCGGNPLPMALIHQQLIIGDRIGQIPAQTPIIPLQQDWQQQQKRLRMPTLATAQDYELDLRQPHDLARSQLLHRLHLLAIPWGQSQPTQGMGTFKEKWRLQWQPEFTLKLIQAGIWGNTILDAATAYVQHTAQTAQTLPALTQLLAQVILANLADAFPTLINRLQTQAAIASDIRDLIASLPALVRIQRYGNVRQTDTNIIAELVDGLVTRICIGLPEASAFLEPQAAAQLCQGINQINHALFLLQNQDHLASWRQVLSQLAAPQAIPSLISGRSCRLLLDGGWWDMQTAAQRMTLALGKANQAAQSASWVAGFLSGSGLLLLHDPNLWQILDCWVTELEQDSFNELLPLLRRSFAHFSPAERRQMGIRVQRGYPVLASAVTTPAEDSDRAAAILPIIAQILGWELALWPKNQP